MVQLMPRPVPGGTGGIGGGGSGSGGQALSLARRMGTQPQGAGGRPGAQVLPGGGGSGYAEGGDARGTYEANVIRNLPMEDQRTHYATKQKEAGKAGKAGSEGQIADSKALQEISKLMGPGVPNPFEELQGFQQHQTNPVPGAPMPRAAPASIRPEPGIQDPTKDLPLSLIYRLGLRAYLGAGSEPLSSYATQSSQNPMDPLRDTALAGLPTIREQPAKATPTSRGAAKRVMSGQKRGGVAKKALAMAKRKKKGSGKRR